MRSEEKKQIPFRYDPENLDKCFKIISELEHKKNTSITIAVKVLAKLVEKITKEEYKREGKYKYCWSRHQYFIVRLGEICGTEDHYGLLE